MSTPEAMPTVAQWDAIEGLFWDGLHCHRIGVLVGLNCGPVARALARAGLEVGDASGCALCYPHGAGRYDEGCRCPVCVAQARARRRLAR